MLIRHLWRSSSLDITPSFPFTYYKMKTRSFAYPGFRHSRLTCSYLMREATRVHQVTFCGKPIDPHSITNGFGFVPQEDNLIGESVDVY